MCKLLLFLAAFLSIALPLSRPLAAQVEPSASGGSSSEDDSSMSAPPPVSGMAYANGEAKSNLLGLSVGVSGAYVNNILPNETATPLNDGDVSIGPSISLHRSTARQSVDLTYSPSFTFYEPTSVLNTTGQSASLGFQFRLTPHVSATVSGSFLRTTDAFNESYPFSNPITGSIQTTQPVVIAPYEEQMVSSVSGGISAQISRDAMIGGSGSYSNFSLSNAQAGGGLYDSTGAGASAYYDRRITARQYVGITDSYSRTVDDGTSQQYVTQVNSLNPFYTINVSRTVSVSVSVGFSYVIPSDLYLTPGSPYPLTSSNSWQPTFGASAGWQGKRINLAASFSRSVVTGGGLIDVYNSYNFAASGGMRVSKAWSLGVSGSYANVGGITTTSTSSITTGDTIAGQASMSRTLGQHLSMSFGYQRLHENYPGIGVISADPDSNRVYATLSYQIQRPLGR
jgi:hypothetical protein